MTARIFQEALVADLTELFSGDYYKTPEVLPQEEWPEWLKERPELQKDFNTHRMDHPKAYAQFLPKRESDDADDPFPYIIARLYDGAIENQEDAYKINAILLVGVFDDDPANQGHYTVLEIMERIQRHFEERPVLAEKFRLSNAEPVQWALQDEESFPYFFGACYLSFDLLPPRNERSKFV